MEDQKHIDRICKLRKFWENNREILKKVYDNDVKFVYDKAAEISETEKKFRNKQREITNDLKVLKICVAGDFSSGKSTFINSLLGEELLGMDINPSTAKITALIYGPELRFFKFNENDPEKIEISKEDYHELSVKKGARKNEDSIDHFEITLPNDLLKRINLYDTPGFNTAKDSNVDESLTFKQIDKSDLVIWLSICCDGSIKSSELEQLKSLKVPFHCIVNQIDDMPEENVDKVLEEIEKQIRIINNHSKVFPYAAKPILENSLRFVEMKNTLEMILKNIEQNNNDLQMEINKGTLYLNGREEVVLPKPVKNHFFECKYKFQKFIDNCILDKEEKRKCEQNSFDRITRQYCMYIITILQEAKTIANEKITRTKERISNLTKSHKSEIEDIDKRIRQRYKNFKKIMVDGLKRDKLYLYHYRNGARSAYDYDDYYELSEYVDKSVREFANSLIEAFKEEYSIDTDLGYWRSLFISSIQIVIEPTIKSIPTNMKIKGMDYNELLKFERQQVDNMIPDELFFSLLNLHCMNLTYQKMQGDIERLNNLVKDLNDFVQSASDLLKT